MIPEAAVEAGKRGLLRYYGVVEGDPNTEDDLHEGGKLVTAILEAAAPHLMTIDAADLQEKLDSLSEWATAMIEESNSPQYGVDVRTIIDTPNEEWRDL